MAALLVYPITSGQIPVRGHTAAVRARLVNADKNAVISGGIAHPVLFVQPGPGQKIEGHTVDIPMYEVPLNGFPVAAGPAILVYITNPGASPSGRA